MLSLAALANWEMSVLASIAGATGTLEERDAQITRSGMYAEYPAIFAGYFELASGVDWRLLAAIGYQESHWDPKATSRVIIAKCISWAKNGKSTAMATAL